MPSSSAAAPSAHRQYARFAWGVLAANVLVILWGAVVRATGSGAGCGSHWPLCDGAVVPPDPAIETLIELGHRVTSGLALLLVAGLVVGAWRRFPAGHPVRPAAVASAVFIVIEALIGAGLVLLEYVADDASPARGVWVAGHLVNTLLLLGALTLTAWRATHPAPLARPVDGTRLTALGLAATGVLLLGTSGAVTALGDTLFPATSYAEGRAATFSPAAHLFVRLRVWHPVLAVAVAFAILGAAVTTWHTSATARRLAATLVVLYAAELLVGLANLWLLAPIALQLVHLALADAVWIVLVLLAAAAMDVTPASSR